MDYQKKEFSNLNTSCVFVTKLIQSKNSSKFITFNTKVSLNLEFSSLSVAFEFALFIHFCSNLTTKTLVYLDLKENQIQNTYK